MSLTRQLVSTSGIGIAILLLLLLVILEVVEAQTCTMPNAGSTLPTGASSSGTIQPDSDGEGPTFTPPRGEDCSWKIDCGAKYTYINRIRGQVSFEDYLYVEYNSNSMRRTGYLQEALMVDPNTEVTVRYTTGTSSSSRPGWVLLFQCQDDPCSSISNTTSSNYTAEVSGTIISDHDGTEWDYLIPYHDRCSWSVTCPVGYGYINIQVEGRTYTDTANEKPIWVKSADGSQTLAEFGGQGGDPLLIPQGKARIGWSIPGPLPFSTTNYFNRAGLRVSYECRPSACASPNGTDVQFDQTALNVKNSILSDPDGAQPTFLTAESSSCTWSFHCPGGSVVVFSDMDGNFLSEDGGSLHFEDRTDGAALRNRELFMRDAGYISPSNYMRVKLTADTSINGVSFQFFCSAQKCFSSSPTGAATQVGRGRQTIRSTQPRYYRGEVCNYGFTCEQGLNFMAITTTGTLAIFDSIIYRQGGSLLQYLGSGQAITGGYQAAASFITPATDGQVDLSFTTAHANSSLVIFPTSNVYADPFINPEWSVEVSCSGLRCTSASAGQTVKDTTSGILLTDADGDGPVTSSTDEACSWRIECPSGYAYLAIAVAAKLKGGSLVVSDHITGSSLISIADKDLVETQFLPQTSVNLQFTTSADLVTGASIGFTCTSGKCSSTNTTGSIFTASSGIIYSDTDGAGTKGRHQVDESCAWTVKCPSGTNFFLEDLEMAAYAGDSMTLTLKDVDSGEILESFNNRADNRWFVSENVEVAFMTKDVGPADPRHGFTLRYQCIAPTCNSINATTTSSSGSNGDTTIRTHPGILMSDIDGHGINQYSPLQLCTWRFVCPTGYFAFTHLNANLGLGDSLFVKDLSTGKALESFTGILSNSRYYFSTSTVSVHFLADEAVSDVGFTARYDCVDPSLSICASPNATGSTFYNARGTIISDPDGVDNNFNYQNGDTCSWSIRCPVGYRKIKMTFNTNLDFTQSDVISLKDPATGEVFFSTSSTGSDQASTYARTKIDIGFAADSTISGGGFTLEYECTDFASLSNVCSSPTATGTALTSTAGSILSDLDGRGLNDFTTSGVCNWTLKCPQATDYISLAVSGEVRLADSLTLSFGGPRPIEFSGIDGDVHSLAPASAAVVSFQPNAALTSTARTGWSLSYLCTRSLCRSANIDTARTLSEPNGTIFSVDYTAGELCQWTINCPALSSRISFKIIASLLIGDYILVNKGQAGAVTFGMNNLSSTTPLDFTIPARVATLSFEANPNNFVRVLHNYEVQYSCESGDFTPNPQFAKTCSLSNTVDSTANSGFVGFRIGESFTKGEICDWSVNCPSESDQLLLTLDSGDEAAQMEVQSGDPQEATKTFNGRFHTAISSESSRAYLKLTTTQAGTGVLGAYFLCAPSSDAGRGLAVRAAAAGTSSSNEVTIGTRSTGAATLINCAESGDVQITKIAATLSSSSQGVVLTSGSDSSDKTTYSGPTISAAPKDKRAVSFLASYFGDYDDTGVTLTYICEVDSASIFDIDDDSKFVAVLVVALLLCVVIGVMAYFLMKMNRHNRAMAKRRENARTGVEGRRNSDMHGLRDEDDEHAGWEATMPEGGSREAPGSAGVELDIVAQKEADLNLPEHTRGASANLTAGPSDAAHARELSPHDEDRSISQTRQQPNEASVNPKDLQQTQASGSEGSPLGAGRVLSPLAPDGHSQNLSQSMNSETGHSPLISRHSSFAAASMVALDVTDDLEDGAESPDARPSQQRSSSFLGRSGSLRLRQGSSILSPKGSMRKSSSVVIQASDPSTASPSSPTKRPSMVSLPRRASIASETLNTEELGSSDDDGEIDSDESHSEEEMQLDSIPGSPKGTPKAKDAKKKPLEGTFTADDFE